MPIPAASCWAGDQATNQLLTYAQLNNGHKNVPHNDTDRLSVLRVGKLLLKLQQENHMHKMW